MKITDILLYAWIAWIVIGIALIKFLEWKGVIRPHGFSRGLTRYRPKPKDPPGVFTGFVALPDGCSGAEPKPETE
jgi:hypothetical protein